MMRAGAMDFIRDRSGFTRVYAWVLYSELIFHAGGNQHVATEMIRGCPCRRHTRGIEFYVVIMVM